MIVHAEKIVFKRIAVLVIAFHAVLLAGFFLVGVFEPPLAKPKQLIVQTVQLKSQTKINTPSKVIVKPLEKPSVAKPIQKQVPQKITKPGVKPAPKQPLKPTVAASKKNIPSQATLNALKSKLATIPKPEVSSSTSYNGEASEIYESALVTQLKVLLKLPEVGAVKVALTLNRQGKVVKTEILASENAANRKLVEMRLPGIQFPPFGSAFAGEKTYTFNLTLTNV